MADRQPDPPSSWTKSNTKALRSLQDDDEYTDLIIKCPYEDFRAHRAIVCPQWLLIKAACEKRPRVLDDRLRVNADSTTFTSQIITIDDIDGETVEWMLDWIYTGNLLEG
ncbi:MAG: hypothetical protein M1820_009168 [Bogoriella megaspora]|nr:MAG: hypothetical protein M1820_009168 [Bogoriella megaspora]